MLNFDEQDQQAILLTIKLASVATSILLVLATPIAWWLSRNKNVFKTMLEVLLGLPILLPPTVIGFYLLYFLGVNSTFNSIIDSLGLEPIVFSFTGLVIASVIHSFPFVMQPLLNAFQMIDLHQLEAADCFGANFFSKFFRIIIPTCRNSILTATIMGFAHIVGEFGVVMMIGGAIPGKTKVLSIAIYGYVEELKYEKAHALAFGMLLFSFVALVAIHTLNNKRRI